MPTLRVHVVHHHPVIEEEIRTLARKVDQLTALVQQRFTQLHREVTMAHEELAALQTEVSQNSSVIDSAVTLLGGLAAKIDELKTNPAALTALADEIRMKRTQLAEAVVAHTPAAQG
jgi:outer membrane murein-binding lipoprotein Lpp